MAEWSEKIVDMTEEDYNLLCPEAQDYLAHCAWENWFNGQSPTQAKHWPWERWRRAWFHESKAKSEWMDWGAMHTWLRVREANEAHRSEER